MRFHNNRNGGYKLSNFHDEPLAVKTNAPQSFLWDVMRCWVQRHPVTAQHAQQVRCKALLFCCASTAFLSKTEPFHVVALQDTPGSRILATPPSVAVDFTYVPGSEPAKGGRFFPNPEPNWGPKAIPKVPKLAAAAETTAAGGGGGAKRPGKEAPGEDKARRKRHAKEDWKAGE
eukprot:SAG22_NODE_6042_length_910_cov_1.398274_2_plen_174_part_00